MHRPQTMTAAVAVHGIDKQKKNKREYNETRKMENRFILPVHALPFTRSSTSSIFNIHRRETGTYTGRVHGKMASTEKYCFVTHSHTHIQMHGSMLCVSAMGRQMKQQHG